MQKIKINNDSLGSENYFDLGFKSEEELNREINKLVQIRSEFSNNNAVITIK